MVKVIFCLTIHFFHFDVGLNRYWYLEFMRLILTSHHITLMLGKVRHLCGPDVVRNMCYMAEKLILHQVKVMGVCDINFDKWIRHELMIDF